MSVAELQEIVERQPFRPFGVRLSNGSVCFFNEPRQLGAPRDLRVIVYFGEAGGLSLIDRENIVEVFEQPSPNGA